MISDRASQARNGSIPANAADGKVNQMNYSHASPQQGLEEILALNGDLTGILGVHEKPRTIIQREMQPLLHMLNLRLCTIKRGTVYEIAETLDSSYVSDPDFRLMFLRANDLQPEPAARQMIKFFDVKLKLFGKDKLIKDITLNDLDDDDKATLRNGSLQVRQSDVTSTTIVTELPGLRSFKTIENELRARYYLLMSVLTSKEVQGQGVVIVAYTIGSFKDKLNGSGFTDHAKLSVALPIPMKNLHFCYDDCAQYIIASAAMKILPLELKKRVKLHHGSEMECMHSLARYGIPLGCLPVIHGDGAAILHDHLTWCSNREIIDSAKITHRQSSSALSVGGFQPAKNDVLFGCNNRLHPGNAKFHTLIDNLQDRYEAADQEGRVKVSLLVVFSMKGTGSRFLTFDTRSMKWKEMQDTDVRRKASKIIQNRLRYKKQAATKSSQTHYSGDKDGVDELGVRQYGSH
jgi:hypothetical protein